MSDDTAPAERPSFLPQLRGESPLPRPLLGVAEMLEDAWVDTVVARRSRQLWDTIVHSLGNYEEATHMLRMWHRDSVLSACRRLADRREDVSSVRRALMELRKHRDSYDERLLPDLVASLAYGDEQAAGLLIEARELFHEIVTGAGSDYRGKLTKASVVADLDRLEELTRPIRPMVDQIIAHRSADPSDVDPLPVAVVDEFLVQVQDIVRRWIHLLRGINPMGEQQYVFASSEMADALRLHDSRAYREAQAQASQDLGAGATAEEHKAARGSVGVSYGLPARSSD